MLTALGAVFLFMGGVLPLAYYACPLLASCTLLVAREECRPVYAWSSYTAIAILGLLLGPDKEAVLFFCFTGYYPLIQLRLHRIRPKLLGWLSKTVLFAVATAALYASIIFVFRLEAVIEEFSMTAPWMLVLLFVLEVVLLLLFDQLLLRFTLIYRRRKQKK